MYGDLLRHQPGVDRDEHGARSRHAEVRLEQLVDVGGEERDAIAVRDPALLERDGEPPRPLARLGPGQAALAVDDGGPVGEGERSPLEEGDRRQRRMRDVHECELYSTSLACAAAELGLDVLEPDPARGEERRSCGTRGRRAPRRAARRTRRRRRAPPRRPPRPPSARGERRRRRAGATTYEPSGRVLAALRDPTRQSHGAKHDSAPVWQAGPAGRTRRRIASPSQSSRISSTAIVFPDVAPLCQYSCRERLQNHASPLSRVRRSASSSI